MIFVGGPDSIPEAETLSPAPSLIKLAVVAACCFEPPHEVNPIKVPAMRHNLVDPFIDRTSTHGVRNSSVSFCLEGLYRESQPLVDAHCRAPTQAIIGGRRVDHQ